MIRCRPLISLAVVVVFSAAEAQATQPVTLAELEQAFRDMAPQQRRNLQKAMTDKGWYNGRIDGAWRPSIAGSYKTLMASPEYQDAATGWIDEDGDIIRETLLFVAETDLPQE